MKEQMLQALGPESFRETYTLGYAQEYIDNSVNELYKLLYGNSI
jgi:hypothetical protein